MDDRTLKSKINDYDSEKDVNGNSGGDYGHRLANALYNEYGMRAFVCPRPKKIYRPFTPRLRNASITKNKVPTEAEKQKMFDRIQRLEERALHGD